ncbi:hypothetical protein [Clostridium perfringens]|uniref:Lipoprotein n=1 Tax=Clostridium perfringens TaxID=1502 RepID=A0AAW4IZ45_CLOPF|nr:hypothetical protein [Clostridium perfringens]MBO3356164.1 hypothetical protein [Clostridium perfringens]MBO3359495.1 hypothetical protein [Clostridium perfringens]
MSKEKLYNVFYKIVTLIGFVMICCFIYYGMSDTRTPQEKNDRYGYILTIENKRDVVISNDLPYDKIKELIGKDILLDCGGEYSKENDRVIDMKRVIAIREYKMVYKEHE